MKFEGFARRHIYQEEDLECIEYREVKSIEAKEKLPNFYGHTLWFDRKGMDGSNGITVQDDLRDAWGELRGMAIGCPILFSKNRRAILLLNWEPILPSTHVRVHRNVHALQRNSQMFLADHQTGHPGIHRCALFCIDGAFPTCTSDSMKIIFED